MLLPSALQHISNVAITALTSVWKQESIRKFRVKFLAVFSYIRTCYAISFHLRDTARSIDRHQWPYGTRPKSFAALGFAVFVFASNLNPVFTKKVMWVDVVADLKPEQAVTFLDVMGIDVQDFIKYSMIEATWPGSSPISAKVYAEVGSRSVDDIPIYLADKNHELATSFQQELKFETLVGKAKPFLFSLSVAIALFVGVKLFHIVMRSKTVTSNTAMDLAYYFSGYYFGAYSLFIFLRYPVDQPTGLVALLLIITEISLICVLMVQFWIFMNTVYREAFKRMIAATSIGAVAVIIMVIVPPTTLYFVLDVPIVSQNVHHFAGML
jgi:hypothetical protein